MDENGPINVSSGSHRFSLKRLWFEYKRSILHKKGEENSFRVNEKEKHFLGLKNVKAIVPPNSIVIANVCAFHRRGDFSVGSKRSAIFFGFRFNPFTLKPQTVNIYTRNEYAR